jgi:serine/threonine-protein kinase
MLTGDPPFTASSAQAVIMKIITDTPRPVNELRRNVPPHMAAALAKALEKLPPDRFETAKAFGDALVMPGFTHGPSGQATAAGSGRRAPSGLAWLPWGVAAVLAVAAALGWMRDDKPASVARLDISPGPINPAPREIVISPDGSTLAVAGRLGGELAIYVRRMDGDVTFRKVSGTEDGIMLAFSPDGRWIVFRRRRELLKVPVAGGSPVTLVSGMDPYSPQWGTDDWIVFSSPSGTFRVSPGGGTPERLQQVRGRTPFLLADGSGVLFSAAGDIQLYDFASDTVYDVGARGAHPVLADNKILFVNEAAALAATAFDRASARALGTPVVVADRVGASADTRGYSVSQNGTLVLYDAAPTSTFIVTRGNHILVVAPGGPVDTLRLPLARMFSPRVSPDGQRVAYEALLESGNDDSTRLNAVDLVTGSITLLRRSEGVGAVWSPDGRRILFSRESEGTDFDLWARDVNGNGTETQLTRLPGHQWPSAWPRENLILLGSERLNAGIDAYTWDPTSPAPPRPYLNAPWNEDQLAVSPNGRLAAFIAEERGVPELYVRDFPVPQNKWRLTTGYSAAPRWSRDGRYLWWSHGSEGTGVDTLYRARVELTPTVTFGAPEVMYATDLDGISNWDLHPDGNRFVIIVPQGGGNPQRSNSGVATMRYLVTLNWFDELRRQLRAQPR